MSPNSCSGKLPPSGRAPLTLAETITQSRPDTFKHQFLTGYIKLLLSSVWPQYCTPYESLFLLQLYPPVLLCGTKIILSLFSWNRYTSNAFKPRGQSSPTLMFGMKLAGTDLGTMTSLWLTLHTVHHKPNYINHVPSGKVDKTLMELHREIQRLFLVLRLFINEFLLFMQSHIIYEGYLFSFPDPMC